MVVAYGAVGVAVGSEAFLTEVEKIVKLPFKPPAKSEGYLVVDTKKCSSCQSCMLACSLVHEWKENTSLSRIQILQDAFERFPNDLSQEQCRQLVPSLVASLAGFEPTTRCLEGSRSIQTELQGHIYYSM